MPILVSPTPAPLPPTHGPEVVAWAERELVHGEGDLEGEPFRFTGHALRAIYRWFEHDGRRYRHSKGLIGWPKGSVKTELEQVLALEHVCGPSWTHGTPVVSVAAVDGDQADELVRRAGMMVPEESTLRESLDIQGGRILQRDGHGRINAVSSALGKNDGKLTSLLVADELHEWDAHGIGEAGAKRYRILERSVAKRAGGRIINVSTAGASLESLLGAMYLYGCKVAAGEVRDPAFLMEWWEASDGYDLDDPAQLAAAIREANPMAVVVEDYVDRLVRSYLEHKLAGKVHEFLRYHLNRWVQNPEDQWMDLAAWDARSRALALPDGTSRTAPPPADGTEVVLGFDGSENGDSTALMGCTIEPKRHWFVVGSWENEPRRDDWRVPVAEVEDALSVACGRWRVKEIAADVAYWRGSLSQLASRGMPVVEFPQGGKDFAAACDQAYEAVTRDFMSHDGDPRLRRHVANARRWVTEHGTRIKKEHGTSRRFIDLAVAGVMADARAEWHRNQAPPPEPFFAVT